MALKKLSKAYGTSYAGLQASLRDMQGQPARCYGLPDGVLPIQNGQITLNSSGGFGVYVDDAKLYQVVIYGATPGVVMLTDLNLEVDTASASNGLTAAQVEAGATALVGTTGSGILINGVGTPVSVVGSSRLRAWRNAQRAIVSNILEIRRRQYDVLEWTPNEWVAKGMVRVPTTHRLGNNSFSLKIHRCITSGVTGATEPSWSTQDGVLSPGASSQTTDGTAVWVAYNLYHFDADGGNDSTGDGSQLSPYRTLSKATIYGTTTTCSGMSGRAWALKRGCNSMYSGYPPGSGPTFGLLYARDPSIDTMINPERFNIFAYGVGSKPRIDPAGKRFGIRTGTSTSTAHHGFLTISDIELPKIVYTADDGGYVVSSNCNATPGYTNPLNIKLFRLTIHGISTTSGTAGGADVDGIWMNGRDVGIYDCDIHDTWDDGIWMNSAGGEVFGNRVWDVARSTTVFPDRERGDVMQINSSITTYAANGLAVIGNYLDHSSTPSKQGLIVNPDTATAFSSNYEIAWNEINGSGVDNMGHSHHCLYAASFSGSIHHNLIRVSGYGTPGSGTYFGIYGLSLLGTIHTNFIEVNAKDSYQAGIYYESPTVSGGPGVEIYHNTVVGMGGNIELGIKSASGVSRVINNVVVSALTGIDARLGCTYGSNGLQSCSIPVNAINAVSLGGDVVGDLSLTDGVPDRSSRLQSAGIPTSFDRPSTDFVLNSRGPLPTIGAVET